MNLVSIIIMLIALGISIIVHEYMHGLVAYFLGDPTAKRAGRLTFNPIAHIDPFGSIIVPLLLIISGTHIVFGWAKPVPVNPAYFKNPRREMMFVSVSGPGSNLAMAAIAGALFRLNLFDFLPVFQLFLFNFVIINIFLAIFNLIPVPPLDGSGIVAGVLPEPIASKYESLGRYGFILIVLILLFFDLIWLIISPIFNFLVTLFAGTGGL